MAREDLESLWLHIAPSGFDIADRVSRRIEERLGMLARHPEMAPVRPDIGPDAGALIVERWLILYRYLDGEVQVGRIVDGARDLPRLGWPGEG